MSSPKPLPEAFWPTIKKAIDKGSNTNPDNEVIAPQCPICMEPLPVRSFPTEGELDAEVLLCGHVLCQSCRIQYQHSDAGGRCPVCRTNLYCSRCKVNAIPIIIPKNGEESSLPPTTLPEGDQKNLCPDCVATVEFHRDVEKGEWPYHLDDMEPGFVSFFYHVVDNIEKNDETATEGKVQEAISDTITQEFTNMMMSRRCVTLGRGNTLRQTNPWYAENNEHQENCRIGVVQRHFGPSPDSDSDSDDDDEPLGNPPSGVPLPVLNPAQTDNNRQNSGLQVSPFERAGLRRVLHPIRSLDDPAQPGNANSPFDVQDGIARPSAATQTSEPARRYHDRALLDEEPDDDMAWIGSSQREGNTVATTAEVLPTSGMFPPGSDNVRPSPRPNRRAERAARAAQGHGMHGGGMQGLARVVRRVRPLPRFAPPSAATQTNRSVQDDEMQAPDADADRLWHEFLEREGNSTPATAEAARPAGPRSLQEAFDYADANDILSLGGSIGGMPQQFRDYLARGSATRPATGESPSPASGASHSSMDLDDSDEVSSNDQPVSER
ncbi:hypothetical protein FOVG_02275 [Fusarium oxysporum f. sp. pisi HDV247]|uniref:RING-type domain-containing protein n=1 Tax=Fusarium oxysporum f. sp. pisi HDV247 TaxID=1080344 RepID=W9PUP0_FUSOX|nr:hypothetical protein FOVG_02275 [Fusarium oxysporum f. sp. pisi HDV247]